MGPPRRSASAHPMATIPTTRIPAARSWASTGPPAVPTPASRPGRPNEVTIAPAASHPARGIVRPADRPEDGTAAAQPPWARTSSWISSNTDAPTTPRSRRSSTLPKGCSSRAAIDLLGGHRSDPGQGLELGLPRAVEVDPPVIVGRRLPGGPGVRPELGHQDLHPVGQRLGEIDRPRCLGEVRARREPPGRGDRVTDPVSGLQRAKAGLEDATGHIHHDRLDRGGHARRRARRDGRETEPCRDRLIDRRGAARRGRRPDDQDEHGRPDGASEARGRRQRRHDERVGSTPRWRRGERDPRMDERRRELDDARRAAGHLDGPPVRDGLLHDALLSGGARRRGGSAGRSAVSRRSGGPGSNGKTGRPTVRPRRTKRTLGALPYPRIIGGFTPASTGDESLEPRPHLGREPAHRLPVIGRREAADEVVVARRRRMGAAGRRPRRACPTTARPVSTSWSPVGPRRAEHPRCGRGSRAREPRPHRVESRMTTRWISTVRSIVRSSRPRVSQCPTSRGLGIEQALDRVAQVVHVGVLGDELEGHLPTAAADDDRDMAAGPGAGRCGPTASRYGRPPARSASCRRACRG